MFTVSHQVLEPTQNNDGEWFSRVTFVINKVTTKTFDAPACDSAESAKSKAEMWARDKKVELLREV